MGKTVATSNPFQDIEGLLQALAAAPQDKEGAFRVATWKMVIEEMVKIKKLLEAQSDAPSTESIKEAIKNEIKQEIETDLSDVEADTILF